jgi:hypothetical protein
MRCIFKKFSEANSGLAIINLVLGIAISGVLMGGLVTSISYIISYPAEVRDNSVVIEQAQNLSYWISRDVQMIQYIETGNDPGTVENEAFTFSWVGAEETDVNGNDYIDTFLVRYVYDTDKLLRYEDLHVDTYDSNGQLIGTTDSQKMNVISEYVSNIEGSLNNAGFTVSATFSYDGAYVQRIYDITPRVSFLN